MRLQKNKKTGALGFWLKLTREECQEMLKHASAEKSCRTPGTRVWYLWDKVETDCRWMLRQADGKKVA